MVKLTATATKAILSHRSCATHAAGIQSANVGTRIPVMDIKMEKRQDLAVPASVAELSSWGVVVVVEVVLNRPALPGI